MWGFPTLGGGGVAKAQHKLLARSKVWSKTMPREPQPRRLRLLSLSPGVGLRWAVPGCASLYQAGTDWRNLVHSGTVFSWQPDPAQPGQIRIDPVWRATWLRSQEVPALAHALSRATFAPTLHCQVWPDFLDLIALWESEGTLARPFIWSGGFNPWLKRGRAEPSAHAGGWAFDLFAPELPLGSPAPPGHRVAELARLAKATGAWSWGGDFARPDPMHFQWRRSPIQ